MIFPLALPMVDVINFKKLRNQINSLNLMHESAHKCENDVIFMQKLTLKLFIGFKIAYFWYISSGVI